MKKARITVHPSYKIGEISPRIYGAFLEPIGSMVNGSMFNPKHPEADELGLRKDLTSELREAGLPCVRLPGGNFVSGWDWKDSIGPMSGRKTHLDRAWAQYIPNDVGHDEYLQWAERAGAEAMYTVNLGTGTLKDAADCIEYTNFPAGTYWSDLRREYGRKRPYGVKVWYLGNEMDGPWQIGSYERDPRGYGVLAHETSKMMKWTDPSIETAACVSSSPFLNHYPDWDMQALQECYELVDYISMHHYHCALPGDIPALMAGYQSYEEYIRTEIALCDYLKTKLHAPNTMMLSLDEYSSGMRPQGEWHLGMRGNQNAVNFCSFERFDKYIRHDPDDWSTRRMPPWGYEMARALANSSTRLTMLRHADRVKIGCSTGGIGELCASDREHTWKPMAHYPFTHLIRYGQGISLMPVVDCEKYDVPGYAIDDMNQYTGFENVDYIQSAAALNEAAGEMTVFVINADTEAQHQLTLDARGFEGWRFVEHIHMFSADPDAITSYDAHSAVLPTVNTAAVCEKGTVTAMLEPLSWNVFRFEK
ncbi:MAG: alpha-L-arabinofuranosidase [Ruminococcaceae bacterium]|nr:alpha-L-arabinofuranosidase [Oscillospiraceae bacterium]